ncbi:MAG: hypothetical protein AAGA30_18540, partial [Planctomycetota bacterium]
MKRTSMVFLLFFCTCYLATSPSIHAQTVINEYSSITRSGFQAFGFGMSANNDVIAIGGRRLCNDGICKETVIGVYNLNTGSLLQEISRPGEGVFSTSIAGNKLIVSEQNLDVVSIFDIGNGQRVLDMPINNPASSRPNGRELLVFTALFDANKGNVASIYDLDTGKEIMTFESTAGEVLTPGDIVGNEVILGAPFESRNEEPNVGAIKIFSRSSGTLLQTLQPNDVTPNARFGGSVAVSQDYFATTSNENLTAVLHIFDRLTRKRLHRIVLPEIFSGAVGEIQGGLALVVGRADGTSGISTIFVVDIIKGLVVNELRASDINAPDEQGRNFGGWTQLSCGVVAAADSTRDVGANPNQGRVYFFTLTGTAELDSDGDGLLDCWETDGLDVNGDGVVDLDLPKLGVSPFKKDLLVEVDVMNGVEFLSGAKERVVEAFANAPVDNPDKSTGINLIILDEDQDSLPFQEQWDEEFNDYANSKSNFFGTEVERADSNWANIKEARERTTRYCAVVNRIGEKLS